MQIFTSSHPSLRALPVGQPVWAFVFFGLLGALLGGCATGEYEIATTIAGGTKIHVPLSHGGAAMTNEGGIQISVATFTLTKDKRLVYVFAFTDSQRRALRSVRVDDVSDEAERMLVDDTKPKLEDGGLWRSTTEPLELGAPSWAWMATISNSLRIFRFTLTFSDGKTQVLHQGTLVPGPVKAAVRQNLGLTY